MRNAGKRQAAERPRRSSRLSEGGARPLFDYRIEYEGKTAPDRILQGERSSIERAMRVEAHSPTDTPNRIFCGDNLGLLRALCDDASVRGKVTLVYIDPPFATGSSLESRDAEHAYDDLFSGAKYLEFLRQRIILLHELLAPSGSLYVHLDGKKAFPVKVILDEVFGASNFRNWITRKKSNRKNYTRRQYGNISDYILFYTKTSEYIWNRAYEPWSEQSPPKEYRYVEPETGRRFMKVPVHAPGERRGETGKPWRGKNPPPGKHWQFPPSVLDELDAKGQICWSPTGNPRRKIYLDESEGIPVQDIWMEFKDAHNQNIDVTGYPTEKNLDMMRRIVRASSNEGDLVMDCFMGSGTTLVAAEEIGRRWIGIDSSVKAVETTLKRLANGSEPMGDYVKGSNGCTVKSRTLFPTGVLRTGFDLFLGDGCLPQPPKRAVLAEWARWFSGYAACAID